MKIILVGIDLCRLPVEFEVEKRNLIKLLKKLGDYMGIRFELDSKKYGTSFNLELETQEYYKALAYLDGWFDCLNRNNRS